VNTKTQAKIALRYVRLAIVVVDRGKVWGGVRIHLRALEAGLITKLLLCIGAGQDD
jgi:hypothetical protein